MKVTKSKKRRERRKRQKMRSKAVAEDAVQETASAAPASAVSSPHSFVGEMSASDLQGGAEREASSFADDHYLSESALCVKVRTVIGSDHCVNGVSTVSG